MIDKCVVKEEKGYMHKSHSYCGEKFSFTHSYDKQPPDSLDNRHCHDVYEILYVMEGVGRFIVEGTSFDIKAGRFILSEKPRFAF
jgi:mannose-6-phosphate isomerase-like protein (cupin superfamily)